MGPKVDTAAPAHSPERKHRRFPLQFPVSVKFTTGTDVQEFPAISRNLSIGGMLLESTSAIPQDCTINFTLTVKKERAVRPIVLAGEGRVVRVESLADGKFTIAVECSRPISELEYLAAS
jgi:PilZ domain